MCFASSSIEAVLASRLHCLASTSMADLLWMDGSVDTPVEFAKPYHLLHLAFATRLEA